MKPTKQDEPLYLVIPAAGLGTRMRAVNPDIPKEMLPVGGKPAIQYAVEEGISAGIKDIVIIINKQKEMIRRYFEDKSKFPSVSFHFLYQGKPKGESDAIALARDIVNHHCLAIIYPDNIYLPAPGALNILKRVFNQYAKDTVALMKVTDEIAPGIGNSGRVDIKPLRDEIFQIKRFLPKGEGHFTTRFKNEIRACGISISGPYIFEYIEKLRRTIKEEEFTDFPVRTMILQERGTLGCLLPGTIFDIGNPRGYELCLDHLEKAHTSISH